MSGWEHPSIVDLLESQGAGKATVAKNATIRTHLNYKKKYSVVRLILNLPGQGGE